MTRVTMRRRMRGRWWSWTMRVLPSCGWRGLCRLRRPLPPPPGEDGGHLLGLQVGDRSLQGPGSDPAVSGVDVASSGVRGRRGAAVTTKRVRLGWAPAI